MNHINSAAWGQTGRLLNTYALFDFKLWSKNLLKMYGFTVETTLFCGFLNLWVILTTTTQPLSSLINIYMRETWENQWQDMLSSDTHGILRYSYSLLSNFNYIPLSLLRTGILNILVLHFFCFLAVHTHACKKKKLKHFHSHRSFSFTQTFPRSTNNSKLLTNWMQTGMA